MCASWCDPPARVYQRPLCWWRRVLHRIEGNPQMSAAEGRSESLTAVSPIGARAHTLSLRLAATGRASRPVPAVARTSPLGRHLSDRKPDADASEATPPTEGTES